MTPKDHSASVILFTRINEKGKNFVFTKYMSRAVVNAIYIVTNLQCPHKVGTTYIISISQVRKLTSKRHWRPCLGPQLMHKGVRVQIQTVWSGLEIRQHSCWIYSARKGNKVLRPAVTWINLKNIIPSKRSQDTNVQISYYSTYVKYWE